MCISLIEIWKMKIQANIYDSYIRSLTNLVCFWSTTELFYYKNINVLQGKLQRHATVKIPCKLHARISVCMGFQCVANLQRKIFPPQICCKFASTFNLSFFLADVHVQQSLWNSFFQICKCNIPCKIPCRFFHYK